MKYIAKDIPTVIEGTKPHHTQYLNFLKGPKFDEQAKREYKLTFSSVTHDLRNAEAAIYDKGDYSYPVIKAAYLESNLKLNVRKEWRRKQQQDYDIILLGMRGSTAMALWIRVL